MKGRVKVYVNWSISTVSIFYYHFFMRKQMVDNGDHTVNRHIIRLNIFCQPTAVH